MTSIQKYLEFAGRFLLASLFLLAGLSKLGNYAGTAGYMASVGAPGALLPLVIALEVFGALAVIVGWQTRLVSLLLAGFSVVTAALFHNNFGDQTQMIMFLKNLSISGAFLMLSAQGAGPISLDARQSK